MQLHTFDLAVFQQRRARLSAQLQALGGGVLVLPTAPEVMRNRDADYAYRPDSYFWYLTGFTEPDALLVMQVSPQGDSRSVLFCRDKNVEREIWEGYRYGPEAACTRFGMDEAFATEQAEVQLPTLMREADTLFCPLLDSRMPPRWQAWLQQLQAHGRAGGTWPSRLIDAHRIIDELRLFKQADEIALMQRAADIASAAHNRAMQICHAGIAEFALEAELLHAFRQAGAQAPAYNSIVATGAHSCVLHYRAGNTLCRDGDMVLIDAGCEFDGYASDITRSFPANGTFTAAQRALYEIVLAAQAAAIETATPAHRWNDGHEAALRVLTQGLIDEKLIDAGLQEALETEAYKPFYMHRTGHWLGMDVHDVGEYREANLQAGQSTGSRTERPWRRLAPGMVLTVEPGLYIRPSDTVPEHFWNIGIRIEDDVVVTETTPLVLSAAAIKTIPDIETLMRQSA